jgi:hypothetical protein
MGAESFLERLKRLFWHERPAHPVATCPFCSRPLVPEDEVVVVQGSRYHADCAIAYVNGQR